MIARSIRALFTTKPSSNEKFSQTTETIERSPGAPRKNKGYFDTEIDVRPLALKGNNRVSVANDVIHNLSQANVSCCHKMKLIWNHFLFPNIMAILFTFVTKIMIKFAPMNCGFPPICLCQNLLFRLLSCLHDLISYWMLWIIFIQFEIYQRLCRMLIFLISFLFIILFYFFSESQGFNWAWVYAFLLMLRFADRKSVV